MNEFLYAVEREYPVSIETLWQAWTDSSALQNWYHPVELSCLPNSLENHSEVGGIWSVSVDVPEHGFVAYFYGLYTEVKKFELMAHTMSYTQSAEEWLARDMSAPHHDVVLDFEDRGQYSWVKFSQFGEMPAEQIELTKAGMESYFDSLAIYLESNASTI
jgi:uncharacterized protein YndB with AHSA1/START domain